MKVRDILHSRLIFVLERVELEKHVFLLRLENQPPKLVRRYYLLKWITFMHPFHLFLIARPLAMNPVNLEPNLYGCNITWMKALEDWLVSTVHIRTIVQLILKNRVAMLFLNATPGAREIVILSKIADLLEDYDQVIVDLPASGHALGILRVPGTAMQLMRSGPIYERAKQILQVFSNPRAMVLLCALPEEMVVNETVEFAEKIRKMFRSFKISVCYSIGYLFLVLIRMKRITYSRLSQAPWSRYR